MTSLFDNDYYHTTTPTRPTITTPNIHRKRNRIPGKFFKGAKPAGKPKIACEVEEKKDDFADKDESFW
jgi:hypothetical protein